MLKSVAPVVMSVLLIIFVAVVQRYSKAVAAVAATMPLTAPLALWVVFAAEEKKVARTEFAYAMFLGIWPMVAFVFAVWLATKAQWSIVAILFAGYAAWAVVLALVFGLRQLP